MPSPRTSASIGATGFRTPACPAATVWPPSKRGWHMRHCQMPRTPDNPRGGQAHGAIAGPAENMDVRSCYPCRPRLRLERPAATRPAASFCRCSGPSIETISPDATRQPTGRGVEVIGRRGLRLQGLFGRCPPCPVGHPGERGPTQPSIFLCELRADAPPILVSELALLPSRNLNRFSALSQTTYFGTL